MSSAIYKTKIGETGLEYIRLASLI